MSPLWATNVISGYSTLIDRAIALLFSACCNKIEVRHHKNDTKVFNAHPMIFTTYLIEDGTINGRVHYTSQDGKRAISYCHQNRKWVMLASQDRQVKGRISSIYFAIIPPCLQRTMFWQSYDKKWYQVPERNRSHMEIWCFSFIFGCGQRHWSPLRRWIR